MDALDLRDLTLTRNVDAAAEAGLVIALGADLSAGRGAEERDGVRVNWQTPQPTAEIRRADGRWILLHSRRDPLMEAERWLAQILAQTPPPGTASASTPTFVLIGAGLGFVLDVIEREQPQAKLIVLESQPALARALLSRRDWRPALRSGRLRLLVGPDYDGAAQAWRWIEPDSPPIPLAHPVLERELPERLQEGMQTFKRIAFDAAANQRARRELGTIYFTQTLRNLPRLLTAPPVDTLEGRGAGWPAVICGAGPSLDRNLSAVHAWRDRAVMIGVDTTLRPLLARGIEPDYVVGVDPTGLNARHLTGVGALRHAWLVAEPSLAPPALAAFGDRLSGYRVSDNHPWPWLLDAGIDCGMLHVWGSVLTAAFSLAVRLGCDPIVLVGADLAYTQDRPYTRGTVFEVDWARGVLEGAPLPRLWQRLIARREIIDTDGIDGATVKTAPHLLAFRDGLQDQVRATSARVINATGAGIVSIPGLETADQTFLESLPPRARAYDPAPGWTLDHNARTGRSLAKALRLRAADETAMRTWLTAAPDLTADSLRALIDEVASALDRGEPLHAAATADESSIDSATAVRGLHRLPEVVTVLDARRHAYEGPAWARAELPQPAQVASIAPATQAASLSAMDDRLVRLMEISSLLAETPGPALALASRRDVAPELRVVLTAEWRPVVRSMVLEMTTAVAHDVEARGGRVPRFMARSAPMVPAKPEISVSDDPQIDDVQADHRHVNDHQADHRHADNGPADAHRTSAPLAEQRAAERARRRIGRCAGRRAQRDSARGARAALCELWLAAQSPDAADTHAPRLFSLLEGGLDVLTLGEAVSPEHAVLRLRVRAPRATWHVGLRTTRDLLMRGLAGGLFADLPDAGDPRCPRGSRGPRLHHASAAIDATLSMDGHFSAGDPRRVVCETPLRWLTPRWLTDQGMKRCVMGASLDEQRAIVTPRASAHSLLIDANGHTVACAPWPAHIVAELHTDRWDVAWSQVTRQLFARRPDGSEPHDVTLEPLPLTAAWADADTLLVSADDGLWRWSPGQAAERIVEMPPSVIVAIDAERILLDPVPLVGGVLTRERHANGWTLPRDILRGAPPRLVERPLGPAGQAWGRAVRHDIVAQAHPDADLIRLESRSSARGAWLAWPRPRGVAWLGDELLVWGADGSVGLLSAWSALAETLAIAPSRG